jgi:hypothetical protein
MTRGALAAVALVALALLGLLPAGSSAEGTPAARPLSTCFWVGPYSTKLGPQYNQAFPDSGAVYWTARYTTPPGATLRLEGKFAHGRYQSLNSYNASNAAPIDALNDLATEPDEGSANPFLPGAERTARKRAYTATVAVEPPPDPALRRSNTLYAGVAGQSEQVLIYRVYLPDTGTDLSGDAGVPKPVLTLADGSVLKGDAACAALGSSGNQLAITTLPLPLYQSLRDQPYKPSTFPASNPPLFRAFYNTNYAIQCAYSGVCDPHPQRIGGQYSNIDNNYVAAFVNREFAPVLVLTGKLPRTPSTLSGEPTMGKGQLRYWSICQNESLATTKGAGCLFDEQLQLDAKRRYTIVTSLPADRPANARRKCGVGYIPWPANGDGAGHPNDGLLLVRNMLPSAGFHHAAQDTATPGDEAAVMGPYLPAGEYMTERGFENRGC